MNGVAVGRNDGGNPGFSTSATRVLLEAPQLLPLFLLYELSLRHLACYIFLSNLQDPSTHINGGEEI